MSIRNPKSIKNRLIYIIVAVSVVALVTITLVYGFLGIRNFQKDLAEDAELHTSFIGEYCIGPLDFGDDDGATQLLQSLEALPSIHAVYIYDNADRLFAYYQRSGNTDIPPQRITQYVPDDGYYHVIQSIIHQEEMLGTIHLVAYTEALGNTIKRYIATLVLIILIIGTMTVLLASRMQRLISNPILALAKATRHISDAADYSLRMPRQSDDEIGVLYDGFNGMLNQIESREEERNRAEAALRESEERFRNLVETSTDWIWEVDREWRYTYVSPKVQDLLGYQPRELLGKTIFDLIVEDDLDGVSTMVEEIAAAKAPISSLPNRNRHKDGHIVVLETNGLPQLNEDGQVIGYRGVDRDITERKRAQEALQDSEQKYRTLFTSIIDPIMIYDRQTHRFIDCNQPAIELYGYSLEEFYSMTPLALHPEEDRNQINLNRVKTGSLQHYTHQTRDGNLIEVEVLTASLFYQERNAWMSIVRDITDRKRAEEELHETKDYLDNILNSMPSILIGVDSSGRITQWNREAEKQTDASTDEVLGRPLDDVLPELKDDMQHITQAIERHDIFHDTKRRVVEDDEVRHMDMTVYPLITSGARGAVIRIDDVSERVRMEELMIQSEKMLSVGGLAAGMAHEINNPLAGIMQNIQVIGNRLFGQLPKNIQAAQESGLTLQALQSYLDKRNIEPMLEAVLDSGRRAAKIVDNMLSFSRKSNSQKDYHNLAELVDQTIELASNDYDLKKKYDFRRIIINREYASTLADVRCEPSKIQQVLLNLLKNGAQAMAEGTQDNAPPRFTIRLHPYQEWARIEIEDNGPGMDDSTQRRVFEPFFTTKAVGVGTGLGLSVSYFIIAENHGGHMKVETPAGGGTNFIIDLPTDDFVRAT